MTGVRSFWLSALCAAATLSCPASAAEAPRYGPELQGFAYPYELRHFTFESQGMPLQMGYMDVPAAGPANGRTIVLLHGKNFCAATWETSIKALTGAGYRVVAPDQIGFCTSSKPAHYQYSFHQLAANTQALLASLGVRRATLLGHSTGGMLATRYGLLYPDQVDRIAMVNPIGLEDWKALGAPYRTVDQWYERELKLSAESVRTYEQRTYYAGRWKPEFDRWVEMLAGLNAGPGHALVAWNSALLYDMIFTQPVYYEFKDLQARTLLIIGNLDNTAIGNDIASPEIKAKLGHYDVLGKQVAALIPHATLVEFPTLGHAPQMEEPARFHEVLLKWLSEP